jgi:hypothetical protein
MCILQPRKKASRNWKSASKPDVLRNQNGRLVQLGIRKSCPQNGEGFR